MLRKASPNPSQDLHNHDQDLCMVKNQPTRHPHTFCRRPKGACFWGDARIASARLALLPCVTALFRPEDAAESAGWLLCLAPNSRFLAAAGQSGV